MFPYGRCNLILPLGKYLQLWLDPLLLYLILLYLLFECFPLATQLSDCSGQLCSQLFKITHYLNTSTLHSCSCYVQIDDIMTFHHSFPLPVDFTIAFPYLLNLYLLPLSMTPSLCLIPPWIKTCFSLSLPSAYQHIYEYVRLFHSVINWLYRYNVLKDYVFGWTFIHLAFLEGKK